MPTAKETAVLTGKSVSSIYKYREGKHEKLSKATIELIKLYDDANTTEIARLVSSFRFQKMCDNALKGTSTKTAEGRAMTAFINDLKKLGYLGYEKNLLIANFKPSTNGT
jgi:hypothetical protein